VYIFVFVSTSKHLWTNLEEPAFDVADFDKLFSKAPARVKSPASKSAETKRTKVVGPVDIDTFCRSLCHYLCVQYSFNYFLCVYIK